MSNKTSPPRAIRNQYKMRRAQAIERGDGCCVCGVPLNRANIVTYSRVEAPVGHLGSPTAYSCRRCFEAEHPDQAVYFAHPDAKRPSKRFRGVRFRLLKRWYHALDAEACRLGLPTDRFIVLMLRAKAIEVAKRERGRLRALEVDDW